MYELFGFVAAAIAALMWGSMFVPMKRLKNPDPFHYHVIVCAGVLASSTLIALILGASLSLNPYGLFSGLIWGVGNVCNILAVKKLGLAKGMSLVLGISILTSFLWGTLFFQEQANGVLFAASGITLILLGLPMVSASKEKKVKVDLTGVMYAVVAGLVFGAIFVPAKLGNVPAADFIFPMATGIAIGGAAMFFAKVRKIAMPEVGAGLTSGLMWSIANIFGLYAISLLGIAVGFPLTQLALLFSVAWGLFFFREVRDRKTIVKIVLGAVVIILGAFALAFSKL
ncbi:MAG: hypothetical protein HY833_01950 [Candidatus Aenigmarchaeota archaeon]|nr:hypothetical protein [Candidatus Aenigmarchaeota archaeon]